MIPAKFDYAAPATVEEALGLLAEHGDEAKVIAGGQSLLPVLRMRLNGPELVVDLGRIESLRGIRVDGDTVTIGAMTPYHEILADETVRERCTLLHQAITEVADPQIRHRGTLGGALVHADPAGDCGAPVLAMDAELVVTGPGGERVVPAAEFFEGLFTTAVGEDELLTAIRVPAYDGWGSHYEKFVRIAHQWPIVAVAAQVRTEGGSIAEARIGLTNMGATPLRASSVEAGLVGAATTQEAVRAACDRAAEGTDPPSDLNGDADYRRHLATVLTRRAVLAAVGG
ncbi:FAD binding domain-containing protein [Janibacter terrae]|uniref:FAD binding domain-containing protein n=1 Tax=Janibacter terrae TaxID=103817 RepID=UPI0008388CBB|nr:xanthine dehydrogenase family protein subunit M [Janibacter terrae]